MKSLFAAGLLALLVAATVHAAGPQYMVFNLGAVPVPGGGVATFAAHINNAGEVTGNLTTANGGTRAFLFSGGSMQNLGTLGGDASSGLGINDAGQVTGWSSIASGYARAFRYSSGSMQDLGTLPDTTAAVDSEGFAINNDGKVTGYSHLGYPGYGNSQHAFVTSGGNMVDLGSLYPASSAFDSYGIAINNSGTVTGRARSVVGDQPGPMHAFRSSGGSMSDLGTLGGDSSYGLGINDSGQVTGWADLVGGGTYDNRHAFVSTVGGLADLGTLPGDTFSHGNAINNSGQVVGSSGSFFTAEHAFLYSGGTMYKLNDLATNLASTGISNLVVANGINDQGWIVGQGIGGSSSAYAFLAIPTTPPAMRIVRAGPGSEVRWPSNANEWTLQTSTTLAPNSWTAIPGPFTTNLGEYVYFFPHNEPRRFFRLFVLLVAGP